MARLTRRRWTEEEEFWCLIKRQGKHFIPLSPVTRFGDLLINFPGNKAAERFKVLSSHLLGGLYASLMSETVSLGLFLGEFWQLFLGERLDLFERKRKLIDFIC